MFMCLCCLKLLKIEIEMGSRLYCIDIYDCIHLDQGIGIKGKEMALVWHEKASRTALQTSSVNLTHTLLVQTHNMTTVKEIAEQCRQL